MEEALNLSSDRLLGDDDDDDDDDEGLLHVLAWLHHQDRCQQVFTELD